MAYVVWIDYYGLLNRSQTIYGAIVESQEKAIERVQQNCASRAACSIVLYTEHDYDSRRDVREALYNINLQQDFWHNLVIDNCVAIKDANNVVWKPIGRYYPLTEDENGNYKVILNASNTNLISARQCPHCVGEQFLIERPNAGAHELTSILCVLRPEDDVPDSYRSGYQPELNGHAWDVNCSTRCILSADDLPSGCSNCGLIGHNIRSCTRPPKFHDMVGIEIEGRWVNLPLVQRRLRELYGMRGYDDCSVNRSSAINASSWEFQTVPGTLREALKQLIDAYPSEADVSCGMHVHVSFLSESTFTLLHTKEFFAFFKQKWEEWAIKENISPKSYFSKRLAGDNDFCLPNDTEHFNMHNMDRYAQINFASWSEHKTVECRLLPMFRDANLAVSAVQHLLSIYEDFLTNPPEREVIIESAIPVIEPVIATEELEVPVYQALIETLEIELNELPPPAQGKTRIPACALLSQNPVEFREIIKHIRDQAERAA